MTTHPPAQHLHKPVPTTLRQVKQRTPGFVKAALRGTTRRYGLVTARSRSGPDFLIIGTKRGGTTSLWNAMVGHPDVLPLFPASREIKSPRYFDLNYWRGDNWYRSHFPTDVGRAKHLQRTGRPAVAGEANPYYMFHPLAPERIKGDYPDVRLIVSLRNPVDRAWSHYRERVGGGTETLSFADALHAEESRLRGEAERIRLESPRYESFHHNFSSYLARGRYAEHLGTFLDLFGDRLLILRAEDYYVDEIGELRRIADFLGLAPYPPQPVRRYNEMPKSSIPADDREFLVDYYRPHVRELEAMLGRRMHWDRFTD